MDERKMASALRESINEEINDPRTGNATLHPLENLVFIALYGVVCGAQSWVGVEQFGYGKRKWLGQFLDLEAGIPSHDTFGRVFSVLEPSEVRRCFLRWSRALSRGTGGQIAIDGKTLRRSFEAGDPQTALHTVAAWVNEEDLLLMGPATRNKDEIGASLELLEMLDLEGTVVTFDALGCQRKIAKKLHSKGADYLLRVRGNQGTLHRAIEEFFDWQFNEDLPDDQKVVLEMIEDVDGGHGRIEERRLWCTAEIDWLDTDSKWAGLSAIARLDSVRHVDGQTEQMTRYYICSDADATAEQMLEWAREHWSIENKAHWVLDVQMREDDSRIRQRHAAENMAMIRRMAMNVLKRDEKLNVGLKNKQLRAACDHDYFMHLLSLVDESL